MNDIFTRKNIYPHEGKIKDHFNGFYESVFIAFLPFIKVDGGQTVEKPQKMTFEEAKHKIDILKNIPTPNAEIYCYSNDNYPSDKEIFENGKTISWKKVIDGSGLAENSELNKALRTSIGALRPIFRKLELAEKLYNYTTNQNIWQPIEGKFGLLSKVAIYKTFKLLNKNQVIVTDEHCETTKTLELDQLTDFEFAEKITFEDYHLYSLDKELLFTIEWDSFFFLIASGTEKMNKIISENLFEGFLGNEKTEHEWDYSEGEIQKYLDIEERQELKTLQSNHKKKWWKFWE
jgi:hypothetical protein